jgi:Protein of unknown function (DUF4232)
MTRTVRLSGWLLLATLLAGCNGATTSMSKLSVTPHGSSSVAKSGVIPPTSHGESRSAKPCLARNLMIRAGRESDGTSFAASGNVELRNVGRTPCRLQGVPDVAMLRSDGAALNVKYSVTKNRPVLRSATLQRGKVASIDVVWLNWCGSRPGPLQIRVELPGEAGTVVGSFDGPPAYNFVPSCTTASRPSRLKLFAAYQPGQL